MTGARNIKGGLILLSLGLAAGLAMSLYAFKPMVPVPEALARYDDLPRRLFRLGHIAAVMLPLINVVLGPWLDRLNLPDRTKDTASWLLLLGAMGLPPTLALEALVPTVIPLHLSGLPALAFSLGIFLVSAGAWWTDFTTEVTHADPERRGMQSEGRRRAPLQEASRSA